MMVTYLIYTLLSVLAVIFVFLFAVEKFSRQVERLAGDKFKLIIQKMTATPFRGTFVGTFVTAVMQSSTAVTVMAVSLVDSGVLPFANSLGVIFGANIGTTITTSLIAFQLLELAPFILIFGFILMKLETRWKPFGKAVFYFGLLFSTLFIISVLVSPLKDNHLIISLLQKTSNIYVSVLVGFLLSTLIQSSAVVAGMVVILSGSGFFGFDQAFAIVLGSNIGTTTTALIAGTVMGKNARRTAVAHFLFNVLGVILLLPFFDVFAQFILLFSDSVSVQVALGHIIFNILSAVIALVFVKQFEKLVIFFVK
jgi:phosphate:Na+ symporter